MKKSLILIASFLPIINVLATDKIFSINGLPEKYSGTLINNKDSSTVVIKNKKTGNKVISQPTEIFDVEDDVKNNHVKTNILQLPYGEQSVIITDDFNFDGKKDLAIRDVERSCYGGPAYKIYLNTGKTLKHSPEFTQLGQEYCGMFSTDIQTQTLSTMTKSGAAWHQYSTFRVIDNKPVAIWILEEEFQGDLIQYLLTKNLNGQLIETNYALLSADSEAGGDTDTKEKTFIFSYTFKNGKQMVLGKSYNRKLFYAFRNKHKHIELFYDKQFIFNKATNILSFENGKTKYSISEKGITISLSKKEINLPVDKINIGKITDVLSGNYDNVTVK